MSKTIEEDIDHLGNIEPFMRLLEYIHSKREYAIGGLYNADDETLKRTAGEIKALDELLIECKYEQISDKWKKLV
tara:strand:+ start:5700 stop:5924 length:225 start_codon:yes stop_codon:yes gene_type:complete